MAGIILSHTLVKCIELEIKGERRTTELNSDEVVWATVTSKHTELIFDAEDIVIIGLDAFTNVCPVGRNIRHLSRRESNKFKPKTMRTNSYRVMKRAASTRTKT